MARHVSAQLHQCNLEGDIADIGEDCEMEIGQSQRSSGIDIDII